MGYNISDAGGEAAGGPDVWTFSFTKGEGITTAGGDFDDAPLGLVDPIDPGAGEVNEFVFSDPTGAFASAVTLTVDGAGGTGGATNASGLYSFSIDFSQITSDTIVEITVIGRRLDDQGNVLFEDEDTIQIELLICIARGTLIDTPKGPVPVEDLCIGDEVRLHDGRIEPLAWVGARLLSADELAASPDLRPVRIAKGALGHGKPDDDLLVSPQHRVLITGWQAELLFGAAEVLAPAKGLVNDRTILVDESVTEIEYFHLMFTEHEIMVTNNLATESFFPGKTSLAGINAEARAELFRILPELAVESEVYGSMAEPGLRTWEARIVDRALRP